MSELAAYGSDDRRREGPTLGSFTIDDGDIDHVRVRDPETGLWSERSVAASEDEIRQRDIDSYRHGLASVDHRLGTLDPNDVMPYERPLTPEQLEERRAGLEAEREFIVAKLAELEALVLEPAPEPETKGRR